MTRTVKSSGGGCNVEVGGLCWPNGYDWSPEALHADMVKAGVLKFETAAA